MTMLEEMSEVCACLGKARRLVVFTGAGVSAESGVPTFRGPQGIWRTFRAEDLATREAFERDPQFVWEWYVWRQQRIAACEPNAGHLAIRRMEENWPSVILITQNIDGLHQRAGSRCVLELHGQIWKARCVREDTVQDFPAAAILPPHCACGSLLRPHVVWFGEALDRNVVGLAGEATRCCDVFLSVGTSARVSPANQLIMLAVHNGATVIEINPEPTPVSLLVKFSLRGPAGELLPQLVEGALAARGAA